MDVLLLETSSSLDYTMRSPVKGCHGQNRETLVSAGQTVFSETALCWKMLSHRNGNVLH